MDFVHVTRLLTAVTPLSTSYDEETPSYSHISYLDAVSPDQPF